MMKDTESVSKTKEMVKYTTNSKSNNLEKDVNSNDTEIVKVSNYEELVLYTDSNNTDLVTNASSGREERQQHSNADSKKMVKDSNSNDTEIVIDGSARLVADSYGVQAAEKGNDILGVQVLAQGPHMYLTVQPPNWSSDAEVWQVADSSVSDTSNEPTTNVPDPDLEVPLIKHESPEIASWSSTTLPWQENETDSAELVSGMIQETENTITVTGQEVPKTEEQGQDDDAATIFQDDRALVQECNDCSVVDLSLKPNLKHASGRKRKKISHRKDFKSNHRTKVVVEKDVTVDDYEQISLHAECYVTDNDDYGMDEIVLAYYKQVCLFCNKEISLVPGWADHLLECKVVPGRVATAKAPSEEDIANTAADENKVYVCTYCQPLLKMEYSSLLALRDHVLEKHSSGKIAFECLFCDRNFTMTSFATRHQWNHLRCDQTSFTLPSCLLCLTEYSTEDLCAEHILREHAPQILYKYNRKKSLIKRSGGSAPICISWLSKRAKLDRTRASEHQSESLDSSPQNLPAIPNPEDLANAVLQNKSWKRIYDDYDDSAVDVDSIVHVVDHVKSIV